MKRIDIVVVVYITIRFLVVQYLGIGYEETVQNVTGKLCACAV